MDENVITDYSLNATPQDFPNNARTENCIVDIFPGTSTYYSNGKISKVPNKSARSETTDFESFHSIESFVCRICHNSEHFERLVSPCLCKGSLSYVHINCLETWISISRCTTCELCQFQYNTEQTLRYSLFQSLRIWYSRALSRRALQEDCQMLSLLTLVALGIVGTLLVAVQYYILQGNINGLGQLWTKAWLIFFLFITLVVYLINVYMIIKSQLMLWYRWWQSACDIKLILESKNPNLAKIDKKSNTSIAPTEESISQSTKKACQELNDITTNVN